MCFVLATLCLPKVPTERSRKWSEGGLEKERSKVKTHPHLGKAESDLIRIAREEEASLVIMGYHGKGNADGIFWGSVSSNMLELSR